MSMPFIIVLNVVLWAYAVFSLVRGKKVELECHISFKAIPALTFFIFGVVQYILNFNFPAMITMVSFTLAAICYYIAPSGLAKEEIVITGKRYLYQKLSHIEMYTDKKQVTVEFQYRNRTYFIYGNLDQEKEIDRYLKKHCKRY